MGDYIGTSFFLDPPNVEIPPEEHKRNDDDETAADPIFMKQHSAETVVSDITIGSPRADSPRADSPRATGMHRQGTDGTVETSVTYAAPDQRTHPTCWIFGITKVILKFLRRFFDKKAGPGRGRLTLPKDGYNRACDQYYNIDKFDAVIRETLFCIKKTSFPQSCFGTINPGTCGKIEYENLCLHMFIYSIFFKKYGDSGGKNSDALMWFTENFINEQASAAKLSMSELPEPYKSVAIGIMLDYYKSFEPDTPDKSVITPRIFVNTIIYFQHAQMIEVTSNCYQSIEDPKDSSDRIPVIDLKHYYFCESGIERSPSGQGHRELAERELSKYIKSVLKQKLYLTVTIDLTGDGEKWWKNFRESTLMKNIKFSSFRANSDKQPVYNTCKLKGKLGEGIFMDGLSVIGLHTMTIISCETRNGELFLKIKNSWGLKWGKYGIIDIGIKELMRHCYLQFTCMDDINFIEIMGKMVLANIKAKQEAKKAAKDKANEAFNEYFNKQWRDQLERLEAERNSEAAQLKAELLEAELLEAELLEAERLEAEQLEAEQLKAERLEAEEINSKLKMQRTVSNRSDDESVQSDGDAYFQTRFDEFNTGGEDTPVEEEEPGWDMETPESSSDPKDEYVESDFPSIEERPDVFDEKESEGEIAGGARRRRVKRSVNFRRTSKRGLKTRRKQKQKRKRFIKTRRKQKRGRKTRR